MIRGMCLACLIVLASLCMTPQAIALGFQLGQSKEELKLQYDVSVVDHGTGRVTITLTITDEGRLSPLTSVDFYIPSKEQHPGGGFKADMSLSLATRLVDGKKIATVHLRRDLAEQSEVHLKTRGLDGKDELLSWYYFVIPVGKQVQETPQRQP